MFVVYIANAVLFLLLLDFCLLSFVEVEKNSRNYFLDFLSLDIFEVLMVARTLKFISRNRNRNRHRRLLVQEEQLRKQT